jgi:predicted enzyme related to lactoylglutathione lyase
VHKSRLGVIVIDCEADALDEAERFWSRALGWSAQRPNDLPTENYVKFETPEGDVDVLLQRVEHPSRVHIDIETDDIEAEAQRLEALGARKVKRLPGWWVMEAPTGHRFCVVGPQRSNFEDDANQWD